MKIVVMTFMIWSSGYAKDISDSQQNIRGILNRGNYKTTDRGNYANYHVLSCTNNIFIVIKMRKNNNLFINILQNQVVG